MKSINRKESGFTIIEVVLVLAIAGLIFLVVFLALPQLQKSQRDSARQSDVGRLIAGISTWSSNEGNGIAPTLLELNAEIVAGTTPYVEDWGYEVDGVGTADLTGGSGTNAEIVAYVRGEDCGGVGTNNRSFAIFMPQESGGVYCREG